MSGKINLYHFWESDRDLNPTGKEKYLKAPTLRWAVNHIAYTLGGELSSTKTLVRMPDGKVWSGCLLSK